MGTEIMYQTM